MKTYHTLDLSQLQIWNIFSQLSARRYNKKKPWEAILFYRYQDHNLLWTFRHWTFGSPTGRLEAGGKILLPKRYLSGTLAPEQHLRDSSIFEVVLNGQNRAKTMTKPPERTEKSFGGIFVWVSAHVWTTTLLSEQLSSVYIHCEYFAWLFSLRPHFVDKLIGHWSSNIPILTYGYNLG